MNNIENQDYHRFCFNSLFFFSSFVQVKKSNEEGNKKRGNAGGNRKKTKQETSDEEEECAAVGCIHPNGGFLEFRLSTCLFMLNVVLIF